MHKRSQNPLVGYAAALLAPALTLLVLWPVRSVATDRVIYLAFLPAVLAAAYLGGLAPGLAATAVGVLATTFFLVEPIYSLRGASIADAAGLALFVLVGVVVSGVSEALRRALRRVVATERQRAEDITDRRGVEEALRASERRFRTFVDYATEAFFLFDEQGRILDVNRRACESLGYARDELVGMTPLDFDPDFTPAGLEVLIRKAKAGEAIAFETRHRRKDGTVFPVEMRGQAFWEGGRQLGVAVARDTSERKGAEEALRESEHRWRSLNEALPHLVWTCTPDGACDYLSTQWHGFAGVPESELLSWRWLELVHPDDRERTWDAWQAAVEAQGDYDHEHRMRRSDGTYRWFQSRGVLIRDVAHGIVKWFGTSTDISERKRVEEELRLAKDRLDLAIRCANIGIWEAEIPDGLVEHARSNYINLWEMLGYDSLKVPTTPKESQELVHPDDRERLWRVVESNWSGDTSDLRSEHRMRHRDGSYRWVLVRGETLRDAQGRPRRQSGAMVDITDRKRTEEALRESEERFRGTFENAAVGIAHKDLAGRFLRVNEKFCEIVGYTRDELLTRNWRDITDPADLAASLECYSRLMSGESPIFSLEKRYHRKDRSCVWADVSVALQRDEAGTPAYAIAMVQDISERKRLEKELRQAKEAAEAANRAKDEFLANVSHEIRTPMNAILGMTELVLDTPLGGEHREYLKTLQSAADSLMGLLNDLLDFSKIEAGKLELDPADFSLRRALGDTVRTLATRAHKKGLELISNVEADVLDALIGDAVRLRQVLLNLVGNAIKFTEAGEVVVRVETVNDESFDDAAMTTHDSRLATHLRFSVADTGIGIPPDKQESIFRAFEQQDPSTTRRYGGTGLGLTIAARLVALMGGTITVESEQDRGSTFAFTARFGVQPHSPAPVADRPPAPLVDLPVLIVDDNATNRCILEQWLKGWHMKPFAVGSGLAALDALWHAASAGRPYTLLLLDARMPDTDGLTLAATIRERAELDVTRIILLTSAQFSGAVDHVRGVPIHAQLLKPLQQGELFETIYRVMSQAQADHSTAFRPAQAQEAPPANVPLNILVAEDNEFNAQLLEQLLLRRGHRIRIASNGREALALTQVASFDLLLLDLHMPELDGFQVVRSIREREQTGGGHLPVIALTARSRKEDRESCLAAGMDEFLSKPIRAAELWATIEQVLLSGPRAAEPEASLLNARILWEVCGGDAAALQRICGAFLSRIPEHLAAVRDALHSQSASQLREAVHKLNGMLAAFSEVACDVATDLEDHAAHARLDKARPLVEQLETMARELMRLAPSLSLGTLQQHLDAAEAPDE